MDTNNLTTILQNIGAVKLDIFINSGIDATSCVKHHLSYITPEKARAILNNVSEEDTIQRKIVKKRVLLHSKNLVKGQFIANDISFAVLPNGKYIILDGQHRLTAFATTTEDYNASVSFNVYTINTSKNAGALFSQFDHSSSKRTTGDNVHAYKLDIEHKLSTTLCETYHNANLMSIFTDIDANDCKDVKEIENSLISRKCFINMFEPLRSELEEKASLKLMLSNITKNKLSISIFMKLYDADPEKTRIFCKGLAALTEIDNRKSVFNRLYVCMANKQEKNDALWSGSRREQNFRTVIWLLWEAFFNNGKRGKQQGKKLNAELIRILSDSDFRFHDMDMYLSSKR